MILYSEMKRLPPPGPKMRECGAADEMVILSKTALKECFQPKRNLGLFWGPGIQASLREKGSQGNVNWLESHRVRVRVPE